MLYLVTNYSVRSYHRDPNRDPNMTTATSELVRGDSQFNASHDGHSNRSSGPLALDEHIEYLLRQYKESKRSEVRVTATSMQFSESER